MTTPTPTLLDWAGGAKAIDSLMTAFYAKVHQHPELGPIFQHAPADHPGQVSRFITEVLGGSAKYTSSGGSHAGMIRHHMGRHLNEVQRQCWMKLLLETADEVGLPSDPEFRSAFVAYLEWGTRLAVINSQPDASEPDPKLPMPSWGWGVPGGPYRG